VPKPPKIVELSNLIKRHDFNFATEAELQDGIAAILPEDAEREVQLGPKDRIDFLVDGIGIEVKIGGSSSEVFRQLFRYAKHDQVKSLLLVTTRSSHQTMPLYIGGSVDDPRAASLGERDGDVDLVVCLLVGASL